MGIVALKALPMQPSPDGYMYFDEVRFSPGSPPDRPHPQPPEPPLGIWGPGDPRPTLPIAGWNPGTGNFPGEGLPGPGGGGGATGVAKPYPPNLPQPPKPEGIPEGSVPIMVFYPGEKYPAVGWVQPYPSSGPVPEPAT